MQTHNLGYPRIGASRELKIQRTVLVRQRTTGKFMAGGKRDPQRKLAYSEGSWYRPDPFKRLFIL